MHFDLDQLTGWCKQVFERAGMRDGDAARAAGLMVRSEVRGYHSHGIMRLPAYVDRLTSGEFNPKPNMTHKVIPGGIILNADGALGHIAAAHAVELGLRELNNSATVLVSIQSVAHMGALGVFVLEAAEAGAMCMLGQNGPAQLAMEGFTGRAIGNNPLAFACPIPGSAPLVFDMSCSVQARGKIQNAAREKQPIPLGWALDNGMQPTTDAVAALEGAQLPAAGPKGMGIAMIVQCLSAGLAANADALAALHLFTPHAGSPGRQSGFAWLIKPSAFAPENAFAEQMRSWTSHYLQNAGENGRLPGGTGPKREDDSRRDGVPLEGELVPVLRRLGERLGVPFPSPREGARA